MGNRVFFRTVIGPRGRVTVSSSVRKAAGIEEGEEVVVTAIGPGVVTIETRQAIRDSIRAANPEYPGSGDAVADVRSLRGRGSDD